MLILISEQYITRVIIEYNLTIGGIENARIKTNRFQ